MEKLKHFLLKHADWVSLGGLASISALSALMILIFAAKRFDDAAISDVFNLSMDVLGTLACFLLYLGRMSVKSTRKGKNKELYFSLLLCMNALPLFLDVSMWFFDGSSDFRKINIVGSAHAFPQLLPARNSLLGCRHDRLLHPARRPLVAESWCEVGTWRTYRQVPDG